MLERTDIPTWGEEFLRKIQVQGTNPTGQVRSSVVMMTPTWAEELLKRNTDGNRPINKNRITAYIKDMESGNFSLNGETIKIALDGRLLDGQHRLLACVRSGKTFPTVIATGLKEEVFSTIDVGMPRSASDALRWDGAVNVTILAAAIRLIAAIRDGSTSLKGRNDFTAEKCVQFSRDNPSIVKSVAIGYRIVRAKLAPSGMAAALHFLFSEKDALKADQFFSELETGAGLPPHHPVLILRSRLFQENASRRGSGRHIPTSDTIAWFIGSWNAYRRGTIMKQVRSVNKISDNGTLPTFTEIL